MSDQTTHTSRENIIQAILDYQKTQGVDYVSEALLEDVFPKARKRGHMSLSADVVAQAFVRAEEDTAIDEHPLGDKAAGLRVASFVTKNLENVLRTEKSYAGKTLADKVKEALAENGHPDRSLTPKPMQKIKHIVAELAHDDTNTLETYHDLMGLTEQAQESPNTITATTDEEAVTPPTPTVTNTPTTTNETTPPASNTKPKGKNVDHGKMLRNLTIVGATAITTVGVVGYSMFKGNNPSPEKFWNGKARANSQQSLADDQAAVEEGKEKSGNHATYSVGWFKANAPFIVTVATVAALATDWFMRRDASAIGKFTEMVGKKDTPLFSQGKEAMSSFTDRLSSIVSSGPRGR